MPLNQNEFEQEFLSKAKLLTKRKIPESEITEAFDSYKEVLFVTSANDAKLEFSLEEEKIQVSFLPIRATNRR